MTAVRAQEAQQDADRGGFTGTVGSEESVYLSLRHAQVEPIQGGKVTELLHEAIGEDGRGGSVFHDCFP